MRSIIYIAVITLLFSFIKASDIESGPSLSNENIYDSSSSSEEAAPVPVAVTRTRITNRSVLLKQYTFACFIFTLIPEILSIASSKTTEIELAIIAALYWIVFIASLYVYSGYFWAWDSSNYVPHLRPLRFSRTGRLGTFGQWIITPLSWLNEIIIFQSNESFEFLQNYYYLPDRSVLIIIFLIQLFYFSGFLHPLSYYTRS